MKNVFVIIKNGGSISKADTKYLYEELKLENKVNFCMGVFYAEVNNLLPLIKKDDEIVMITFSNDVYIFKNDDIKDIKQFIKMHPIYKKSYDALEAYLIFKNKELII